MYQQAVTRSPNKLYVTDSKLVTSKTSCAGVTQNRRNISPAVLSAEMTPSSFFAVDR